MSRIAPIRGIQSLAKYDPVQVFHMQERCIAVNEKDEIIGEITKVDAHAKPSLTLHRAFSVFAFTPENRLILQKRSDEKITFPSLWTNTCCSHPLYNESEMSGIIGVKKAAIRKLEHELNITGVFEKDLLALGRYLYKAAMSDSQWGEHELDYGLVLKNLDLSRVHPNAEEVSEVCTVSEAELSDWIKREPESFSPWFSLFVKQNHLSSWWKNLNKLESLPELVITHLN